MFRLVVLPCFGLCRCNNFHVMLMLSLSLPVYQVRLDWSPLPCIALIRPSQLSCLGSSVGRASASLVEHLPRKQYVVGSNPI